MFVLLINDRTVFTESEDMNLKMKIQELNILLVLFIIYAIAFERNAGNNALYYSCVVMMQHETVHQKYTY